MKYNEQFWNIMQYCLQKSSGDSRIEIKIKLILLVM